MRPCASTVTRLAFINSALLALKRVFIVILIAFAFSVGLFGAIILSLHSSQTKVPDIMGKDRTSAENAIEAAHLNFRVRAIRPVSDAKPNTVIIQIPNAGEDKITPEMPEACDSKYRTTISPPMLWLTRSTSGTFRLRMVAPRVFAMSSIDGLPLNEQVVKKETCTPSL